VGICCGALAKAAIDHKPSVRRTDAGHALKPPQDRIVPAKCSQTPTGSSHLLHKAWNVRQDLRRQGANRLIQRFVSELCGHRAASTPLSNTRGEQPSSVRCILDGDASRRSR
jgi:hypothetical protein